MCNFLDVCLCVRVRMHVYVHMWQPGVLSRHSTQRRFGWVEQKYGVKVASRLAPSVEGVALAVGELIGPSPVKSAAGMNKVVVLFL